MRIISLTRFWFVLMVCIILCIGFLLTLNYSNVSKAERKTLPYELLYTKQNNIPYSSSTQNENTGNFEEELPYEPISKGIITVTYDSQSFGRTNVTLNK
ncbi:hypothetical protein ABE083_15850 [Bacillus mycoides]|uniref:Uncharacterized protein n=1 Tax=Bacillus mycoides TaxID=1405 RepID=A0A1S9TE22_BACMY|nr:hypothetical protein [Bacillus mycoides]OOR07989.1 hypothetical protein BW900_05595 [Bacillus mycoides]